VLVLDPGNHVHDSQPDAADGLALAPLPKRKASLAPHTDLKLFSRAFGSETYAIGGGRYLLSGASKRGLLTSQITHHELLHLGQYLRSPSTRDTGFVSQTHELLPGLLGSPVVHLPLYGAVPALSLVVATQAKEIRR